MFATASLAARIERAECAMLAELARAAARRLPAGQIVASPIGGGIAVYAGADSPANKLAGLGFADPPTAEELAAVEHAFAERNAPLQVELSSLADPAIARLLDGRGYALTGFENVLGISLDPSKLAAPERGPIEIARAEAAEAA